MEDVSIRAVVIGVSLFVTMITVTAILSFYNVSILTAQAFNKRVNIAEEYDYIMNSDVFTDELTGVELRNLINKYANNAEVVIFLKMNDKEIYENINNKWLNSIGNISEAQLNVINPSDKYRVTKTSNCNVVKYCKIKLDVEKVVL